MPQSRHIEAGRRLSVHVSVARDRCMLARCGGAHSVGWGPGLLPGIVLSAALMALGACGGRAKHPRLVAPNAQVGACADPRHAGVLSENPRLRSAHRDLNGDGTDEKVFADRELCKAGNCWWNLFADRDGCSRYLGTISGATLEVGESGGEGGFSPLRAWWKLPSGGRQLVQNYEFRDGGYQLVDVLVCRQGEDDRLLCASEEPHARSRRD